MVRHAHTLLLVLLPLFLLAWPGGPLAQPLPGWSAVGLPEPAQSTDATPPESAESPEESEPQVEELPAGELRALVETLDDPERREALLAQVRALIAAREAAAEAEQAPVEVVAGHVLATMGQRAERLVLALEQAFLVVSDTAALSSWLDRQVESQTARIIWRDVVLVAGALIAAGWFTAWLARGLLHRLRRRGRGIRRQTWTSGALVGVLALLVAGLPIIAFAVVGYLILTVVPVFVGARVAGYSIVIALAGYHLAMLAGRLLLAGDTAPGGAAGYTRLVPVADGSADYFLRWTRRFALVAALTHVAANAALALGLPASGYFALSRTGGLAMAVLAIAFIMQNRCAVSSALKRWTTGHGQLALVRPLGDVWHVLAALYVFVAYLVWAAGIHAGLVYILRATVITLAIAGVAWVADTAVLRLARHLAVMRDREDPRYPWRHARAARYVIIVRGAGRGLVVVVTTLAILEAWGVGILSALAADVGREGVASIVQIVVVVALALLVWEFANGWIRNYLSRTGADDTPVQRSQRAKTLLPLLRTALLIVLVLVTGMTILSEVGVNIAPLLASAGVIGLAIGFGSQKLVQDVITGIFILIEDTIHVGDIVTAGTHTGEVENITIRTIQLRDLDGAVHTVPFSDVTTLVNLTKDFSYRMFEVGVAYREDTDHVTDILVEIADEMRAEPQWSSVILEPMEVMGVERFEDSAVIIRVRLKTRPLHRWAVGREFNRRMKKRFDELGIEIPFPHRTLYFGNDPASDASSAQERMLEAARRSQLAATGSSSR